MPTKRAQNSSDEGQQKGTRIIAHFCFFATLVVLLVAFFIDFKSTPVIESVLSAQHLENEISKVKENWTREEEVILEVPQLRYWGICESNFKEIDSLRSMNRVFERLNYKFVNDTNNYDVVWSLEDSVDSPYNTSGPLKQHQKINHIPGNSALVTKVFMNYYNRHSPYILPSFTIDRPGDRKYVEEYVRKHPDAKFVRKNVFNRGVEIIEVKDINDEDPEEFFQVFLDKPFLIDGHAFDMGVFVLITSLDPLRIYKFDHEVLLRFCPKKYHPFDSKDLGKYVVQDDHKSAYEMKGFGEEYKKYSITFKELFEKYLREQGHNVEKLWAKVDDAIVSIIKTSENLMLKKIKSNNRFTHNYFELVRFDFMIDHKLDVFVMEVNMSPNMTPAEEKFEENSKIYEPMIYSTVEMIGGGSHHEFMSRFTKDTTSITSKNLVSSADVCIKHNCAENCAKSECQLCLPCLSTDMIYNIREAYREWKYQGEFVRVFPTAIQWKDQKLFEKLSENNQLMTLWFKKICEKNARFC